MSMQPFVTLSGKAAAIREDNIDTDIIFPARFLLITARAGLGKYAFHDRRFTADGAEIADFVLNKAPWRDAPIVIAGANFGSGSSREQAVWALLGHGIRCVIAPGFGEIFHGNCFRNGVLPITLAAEQVAILSAQAEQGQTFRIDLPEQTVSVGDISFGFEIEPPAKEALLNGWDETAMMLAAHGDAIAAFEEQQRASQPWLYELDTQK